MWMNQQQMLYRWLVVLYFCTITTSEQAAETNIISKLEWNGRASATKLDQLTLPVDRVIIIHTAGADCSDRDTCEQQVRNIQHYQMNKMHFDDIAYNFLVGNDGNVYEGRGWSQQGAFARGFNAGSLGIAFIGNFNINSPSEAALSSAKNLLKIGMRESKISSNYRLLGHRQAMATNSPGDALYAIIKQWPHWTRKVNA